MEEAKKLDNGGDQIARAKFYDSLIDEFFDHMIALYNEQKDPDAANEMKERKGYAATVRNIKASPSARAAARKALIAEIKYAQLVPDFLGIASFVLSNMGVAGKLANMVAGTKMGLASSLFNNWLTSNMSWLSKLLSAVIKVKKKQKKSAALDLANALINSPL